MSSSQVAPQDTPDESVLARRIFDIIRGYISSELVFVAAKLQLADHIAAGARLSPELAERTGTDAAALERVLKGLAHLGICRHDDDGGFSLTPLGRLLTSDHPLGYQNVAIVHSDVLRPSIKDLLYSTQTGNVGIERALGAPLFEYLAKHETVGERFDRFMTTVSTNTARDLLATYDFSAAGTIVDVGGGRGTLIAAILQRYPAARGVLFELPHVAPRAGEYLQAQGVAERCDVVSGDFFVSVPPGGDVYLLSQILHDWDDVTCRMILAGISAAMPEGSRLLVLERILPERITGPNFAVGTDLIMLTVTGGQERTEAQYRRLLGESGFGQVRVIPMGTEFSIIEAAC